jgi:hypothetical protein
MPGPESAFRGIPPKGLQCDFIKRFFETGNRWRKKLPEWDLFRDGNPDEIFS